MTISRLASAAALGLALTGTAFAADLPMRSAPPPFVPPPPVFTWTGFYMGLNAGYAFDASTHTRLSNTLGSNQFNQGDSGFTGGGQIGYNYQFGAGSGIVVGVEADAAYTDLGKLSTVAPGVVPGTPGTLTSFHGSMDFLGTVRGRVGYAWNQFLVYGTGGFAYGDVNDNVNSYGLGPAFTRFHANTSGLATGYAYGGGIEYALPTSSFLNFFHSSAVTVKAEYLHYDLGDENVALVNTTTNVPGTTSARFRNDGDLIRAGINYKF